MRHSVRILVALLLVLPLLLGAVTPAAAQPLDLPIPHGHFYKQANGQGGAGDLGFAVTDDHGIPFWTAFRRLGDVPVVGYPISRRFTWDGLTVQAFQKLVLQWQPEQGVSVVNVFDRLSAAGQDAWLESTRATPPSFDNSPDAGLPWPAIVQRHLDLLNVNPAIRARYLADADAVTHFGLPMSSKDYGNVFVVRAQRAVLQQWKTDVPWARAGQITIANGGDIAREAGLFPAAGLQPELVPTTRISPELEAPLQSVNANGGAEFVQAALTTGAVISFEDGLPARFKVESAVGAYFPADNIISVGSRFRGTDPRTLGAVLAHETYHLYQTRVLGLRFNTPLSCLRRELEAFAVSAEYWGRVFPNGKPNPANRIEADLNALLAVRGTPAADDVLARILSGYIEPGGECSPL